MLIDLIKSAHYNSPNKYSSHSIQIKWLKLLTQNNSWIMGMKYVWMEAKHDMVKERNKLVKEARLIILSITI